MTDLLKPFFTANRVLAECYEREREYFNEKPERPLLPALVPTPELLPAPAERDESDTRVSAD